MQLTTVLTATILILTTLATPTPLPSQDTSSALIVATTDLSSFDPTTTTTTTTTTSSSSSSSFSSSPPLSKRLPANFRQVVYCTDARHRGMCRTDWLRSSICYNVAANMNDRISSVYPGKGTYCMVYDRANCDARKSNIMVSDPGAWDLKMLEMNDKVSSIKCVQYG